MPLFISFYAPGFSIKNSGRTSQLSVSAEYFVRFLRDFNNKLLNLKSKFEGYYIKK